MGESRPQDSEPKSIPAKVAALFAPFDRTDAPGLVVGVKQHGQVLYRRGLGMASIEHAVANTHATRMRIGSTTKHFTCLAVMLLAEDGKLEPDDGVRKYIPELPTLAGEPTLRQLMQHSGGYRCQLDVQMIANGMAMAPAGANLATQLRQGAANFAPGERMNYCNGGYHLLSHVVARVAGIDLVTFMRERIFGPLGMNDTLLAPSDLEILPGMATLHLPSPTGGWRRGIFPSEDVLGEGGIVSTVDDMLTWMAHLRAEKKTVGSAATWAQMTARARYNGGREGSYGLGLTREMHRGVEVVHHAGGVIGGSSQMITVPAEALDIILMCNGAPADVMKLANDVIDAVLGDKLQATPAHATAKDHAGLIGRYFNRDAQLLVELSDREGKLDFSVQGPVGLPLPLTPDPDRTGVLTLDLPGMGAMSVRPLATGADDKVQALEYSETGLPVRMERLTEAAPTVAALAADLAGRYASADADADAEVSVKDDKLTLNVRGKWGSMRYGLEPLAADFLLAKGESGLPLNAVVVVKREGGRASGFHANSTRTHRLWFARQS